MFRVVAYSREGKANGDQQEWEKFIHSEGLLHRQMVIMYPELGSILNSLL